MTEVSLEAVYRELKDLKKEVELIRFALVPEEMLGEDEVEEISKTEKEMEQGERIELEDALKKI